MFPSGCRITSARLHSNELTSLSHSLLCNKEAVVGQLQNCGIFISVGIAWQWLSWKGYSEYNIPFLLIRESYLVSESNLGAECLLGNFLMSSGTWFSSPSEEECHLECPESSHEHFGRHGDATQLEKNSVLWNLISQTLCQFLSMFHCQFRF